MDRERIASTFEIQTDRYSRVYEHYVMRDGDDGTLCRLVEYRLLPGIKLFAVWATYAKLRRCTWPYYVAAKNENAARRIFRTEYSYLNIIEAIEEVPPDMAESILKRPSEIILI